MIRKGKILYLANAASVHTLRWINYFADQGWEVHLLTWRKPLTSFKLHPNLKVHRIHIPQVYPLTYLAFIQALPMILKIRPNIIHAHYLSHFGIMASLYRRLFRFKPIVLTAWGSDVLVDASKGVTRWAVRNALQTADIVTCDGENALLAIERLGRPKNQINLIYFGTDTSQFKPLQRDMSLQRELELGTGSVVISLRSHKPIYDVKTLITAIPIVLLKHPDTKFIICGDGIQRLLLIKLAKDLSVIDNVRFTGSISNQDLPKYLNLADVYVSTSLSDSGLAVSTGDAMACGLPVVITDFGDNGLWVKNGLNGYLFEPGNSDILAKRIVTLLDDRGRREQMGRNNCELIQTKNSWINEMSRMESVYNNLLERHCK